MDPEFNQIKWTNWCFHILNSSCSIFCKDDAATATATTAPLFRWEHVIMNLILSIVSYILTDKSNQVCFMHISDLNFKTMANLELKSLKKEVLGFWKTLSMVMWRGDRMSRVFISIKFCIWRELLDLAVTIIFLYKAWD